MPIKTHGIVRKQVTSTWLRLEADESGVHIRGHVVRLDTAAQWRALDGTRYETEASRFFFHSKIVWMIIPKEPKPPPRMTPAVAPKKVATPTGPTSCHGIICRKKPGVILPEAKPNSPPSTIPISAVIVTVTKIFFQVIAC